MLSTVDHTVTTIELLGWLQASWQLRPKGKHSKLYNADLKKTEHRNHSR
jgi:hypothetical protein